MAALIALFFFHFHEHGQCTLFGIDPTDRNAGAINVHQSADESIPEQIRFSLWKKQLSPERTKR